MRMRSSIRRIKVYGLNMAWIFIFDRVGVPLPLPQFPSGLLFSLLLLFDLLSPYLSDPLIMVVDGDGGYLLCFVLADYVFIQVLL
jgi:hypothetical protein